MPDITVSAEIVSISGPANAIALARIIQRCRREAQRARYMAYADRLLADDTGLSRKQAQRARQYWQQIGVIHSRTRGMPPITEYDTHATLDAYAEWLSVNGIQHYETRAERIMRLQSLARDYGIDTAEIQRDAHAPHVKNQDAYYEACLQAALKSRIEEIMR
jgi:DNA-binding transcriptional MocR family regulator